MSGCLLFWIKTWLLQNIIGFKWFKSPLRISDSQVVSKNIDWQTCSTCQNLCLNLLTLRLMETCHNSENMCFPQHQNQWQTDILPPIWLSSHHQEPLHVFSSLLSVSFSSVVVEPAWSPLRLFHLCSLCFRSFPPSVFPANTELRTERGKSTVYS